jgi:hypothetical protein
MLLKEAVLDILVKLADSFDRANLDKAAEMVDAIIEDLGDEASEEPQVSTMKVEESEMMEIKRVLQQALESMNQDS